MVPQSSVHAVFAISGAAIAILAAAIVGLHRKEAFEAFVIDRQIGQYCIGKWLPWPSQFSLLKETYKLFTGRSMLDRPRELASFALRGL
jgi:hypothetical protein